LILWMVKLHQDVCHYLCAALLIAKIKCFLQSQNKLFLWN
jgi:hypothetical protein